ncbi:choice-of-anchor D domain-containing protein [Flavobacterium sp.]|uniref:choice-of-anchor D domain-containing protein n=1 Tax=Flavobacterium sp. TaxID=239 RepID=UPI0037C11FDF
MKFKILFLTLLISALSWGQILIPNTTPVTQNFDGMSSSATATLPTGFVVNSTVANINNYTTGATTATTQAAGTSGLGILTGTSTGGCYNYANGITASSIDRALGFLTSGGYLSPRSILVAIQNTGSAVITDLSIIFDYEKYRSGSRQFDWAFFHGATSTAVNTAAAAGNQSYPADANNTTIYNPPTTTSKTVTLTGLSIPVSGIYYLCWTFKGLAGSTNCQGTGIDNLSITATFAASLPPVVTAASSLPGTVGSPFSYNVIATNSPTNYAITAGTLPAGLTINATTGVISGTPSATSTASVTVTATNGAGSGSNTISFSIVLPPPPIVTASTFSGTVGTAFSNNIVATNLPTSYAYTGVLPGGLSFDTTTGAITGTPTVAASSTISVTATNAGGTSTAATITFNITNLPVPVLTGDLTITGVANSSLTYTFIATNTPTSYTLASGLLPPGMSLNNPSFGVLGFLPNTVGVYNFTITATNAGGTSAPATFRITITGPEISVQGNLTTIVDGDLTPTTADFTDFGNAVLGNNVERTFTIQNTGSAALTLSGASPYVVISGANAGDFSVTVAPVTNSIAAAASTTFTVRFLPTAVGLRTATITINNNDGNEGVYDFAIQGTGTLVALVDVNVRGNGQSIPDNSIYPQGTNHTAFGIATVGVTTVVRTFTIENVGSTALNLTNAPNYVTVTGPHASMFTVTAQPSAGTIAGASSLTFQITFDPTSQGAKYATVVIANDDTDENPYSFNISGTAKGTNNIYVFGNGNDIIKDATTTSLTNLTNFSSVAVTTGIKQNTFVITNLYGATIYLSNVTISGTDAAMFSVISQPNDGAFSNGNSTSFTINFTPTSTGVKTATVTFNAYTDAARTTPLPVDPVFNFAISGNGIVYSLCTFNAVQTIAQQDFEVVPVAPVWSYTQANDGDLLIGGGTFDNGSGVKNAFIDSRSLQFKSLANGSIQTATISMGTIDASQYSNVNLSFKAGAFRGSSGAGAGLDINDFVEVDVSVDGGVNWSTEAVLRGYSDSRWDFAATGVFNAYYTGSNNGATIDSRLGNAELAAGYATYNVKNLPSASNLLVRIVLVVNRVDEIWAIDNIKIEGQTAVGTTWDGANWSAGFPNSNTKAIFNANYTTNTAPNQGSVEACECQINSGVNVTVASGYYFEIQSNLSNEGNLTIASNGSLVQVNDSAINTGDIIYQRTANGVNGYDYVYWSSPVLDQPIGTLYSSPSPGFKYEWNPIAPNPAGSFGFWVSPTSSTMELAKGYIVRASSSYGWTGGSLTSIFRGKPNNGLITPTLSRIANSANVNDRWNLIGNPYPSALDAKAFLLENAVTNPTIDGYIALWQHLNAPVSSTSPYYDNYQYNYTNDYLIYNRTGLQAQFGFDGYVASGQAFFVNLLQGTSAATTVTFKNSFRSKMFDNSQFLRTSQSEEGRIWVDLVDVNNVPVRSLIGYVEGATQERDRLYDAITTIGEQNSIYSLIDNEIFVIQGRMVPFDNNDQVNLGINAVLAGTYKIAVAGVDGFFNQDSPLFLEDKLLNIIHDLRVAPYNFSTTAGQFNNRFVLRYTNTALGNPDFGNIENSLIVAGNQGELTIKSSIENIQEVTIYDVLGRQLFFAKEINNTNFVTSNISLSQQTLIVKIKLENGMTISRKVIL